VRPLVVSDSLLRPTDKRMTDGGLLAPGQGAPLLGRRLSTVKSLLIICTADIYLVTESSLLI
jgi:hypothetical protein